MDYVKVPRQEYEQLLVYKQIIGYVEDELHEKERIREDFAKEIEKISENVKKGKKVSFSNKNEMNSYLDRL